MWELLCAYFVSTIPKRRPREKITDHSWLEAWEPWCKPCASLRSKGDKEEGENTIMQLFFLQNTLYFAYNGISILIQGYRIHLLRFLLWHKFGENTAASHQNLPSTGLDTSWFVLRSWLVIKTRRLQAFTRATLNDIA